MAGVVSVLALVTALYRLPVPEEFVLITDHGGLNEAVLQCFHLPGEAPRRHTGRLRRADARLQVEKMRCHHLSDMRVPLTKAINQGNKEILADFN